MKQIFFIILLISNCSLIYAQEEEDSGKTAKKSEGSFSIFGGGAIGNFESSIEHFTSIYSNRSVSRMYVAGIGDGTKYLFAKYHSFYAHGKSIVSFDAEGKADWDQQLYTVGVRLMSDKHPFIIDFGYAVTDAHEKISTKTDPVIPELESEWKTKSQGFEVALGFALFPSPIRIYGEVEYFKMIKMGETPSGKTVPQLGGLTLSAGILLVL